MTEEILFRKDTTLVRRLNLEPGEALPWHRDPYYRVAVVLRGESLIIEYADGTQGVPIMVAAGQVDWDEPTDRLHRGTNSGEMPYEEITIFFLDRPEAAHQPGQE